VEAKIEWEVVSAVCIGSTADVQGIGVDKATTRGADGMLIIPGSTLKGRIRWECERIAHALGWEVCDAPQPGNMCPYFWLGRREPREDRFCVLCEIFGSAAKQSALWFTDATLKKDERIQTIMQGKTSVAQHRPFDAQIRPGVSLSRARRTALNERLFFTETSAPNARLHFEATIEGNLPSDRHRALLLAGVRFLSQVGGGRSRGLGWIRLLRCTLDGNELTEGHWRELLQPLEETVS
jgi:CRISPR/Cas system CSM-associated protein Csm3 (group 7 of RAMP superfamily)